MNVYKMTCDCEFCDGLPGERKPCLPKLYKGWPTVYMGVCEKVEMGQ